MQNGVTGSNGPARTTHRQDSVATRRPRTCPELQAGLFPLVSGARETTPGTDRATDRHSRPTCADLRGRSTLRPRTRSGARSHSSSSAPGSRSSRKPPPRSGQERPGDRVAAVEVDVVELQGMQAGADLERDHHAGGLQPSDRCVDVEGVPPHHAVQPQAQRYLDQNIDLAGQDAYRVSGTLVTIRCGGTERGRG